jgi:hypothetical protein
VTHQDPPPPVRAHGEGLDLERLTYATIVVMSVLAVYPGWEDLSVRNAAAVIFAPIIALATAHYFSEVLHLHAELQRPLTRTEWREAARRQWQVVLAGVPPLLLMVVGRVVDQDVERVTLIILGTGVVTLMLYAGLAGRRAGIRGWRLAVMSLAGGAIGLLVLSLQILLKPAY